MPTTKLKQIAKFTTNFSKLSYLCTPRITWIGFHVSFTTGFHFIKLVIMSLGHSYFGIY